MLRLRRARGWSLALMLLLGAVLIFEDTTPAQAAPDVPEGCWAEEYKDDRGFTEITVMCP